MRAREREQSRTRCPAARGLGRRRVSPEAWPIGEKVGEAPLVEGCHRDSPSSRARSYLPSQSALTAGKARSPCQGQQLT